MAVGLYAWKKEHDYLSIASLDKGDTVVDVGAYDGLFFTVPSAKKVENGIVYAIEPDEENVEELRKNIALNDLSNVVVIQKGVWSESTRAGWNHQDGSSKLNPESGTEVELATLDSICSAYGIDDVDLIKMDIEGAELEALNGMENTLDDTKQIIVSSYHGSGLKKYLGQYGGGNVEEVSSFLKERGFTTSIYYPGLVYGF